MLLLTEDCHDSRTKYVTFQHKILQEYAAAYYLHKEYLNNILCLEPLFPTLRCIIDHRVVLQFLCGQSEDMSETVMNMCCHVVANSFAAMDGAHWHINERAYLSGINKNVPPYKILSWPDAVGTHLQTTFETIRTIHGECKQPANIDLFCGRDLWILSPDAWSIPLNPPNKQKLVIVHNLDINMASTYLSVQRGEPLKDKGNQCVLITNVREDYQHVVPCLTRITSEMGDISAIFLCDLLFHSTTDQGCEAICHLSQVLFGRKNLKDIAVLRSKIPETFYIAMFEGVAQNIHLEKLDLYLCEIPHAGISLLPKALSYVTKLNSLKLRKCICSPSDAETICKQICHLVSLKHLDLSENPHLGCYVEILANTFLEWEDHPLEKLWVRECYIPVEQGQLFLKSLTNLRALQLASLSCNGLDRAVPELMSKAPPLEELYLWQTGLQTEDVLSIAAAVQAHKVPKLRRLHLEGNDLTDDQIKPLLAQLDNNHVAEILIDLSNNKLSKEFVEHWRAKVRNGLNIC